MKKFASLIAVMALLAFAGMAFAVTAKNVNKVERSDTTPSNMGALSEVTGVVRTWSTNVYYFGQPKLDLGLKTTLDGIGDTGNTIKGTVDKADVTVDPSDAVASAEQTNKFTVSFDKVMIPATFSLVGIGEYATSTPGNTASVDVTAKTVAMEFVADPYVTLVDGENQTFKLGGEGYSIVMDDPKADIVLSDDVKLPAGIHAVVSGDTLVVSADKTAKAGKCVVEFKVVNDTAITVSEDVKDGKDKIAIAGLAADDIIATVEIEVVENPAEDLLNKVVASPDLKKELKAGPNLVLTNAAGAPVGVNATDLGVVSADRSISFSIISVDMTGATSVDVEIKAEEALVFVGDHKEGEKASDAVSTITGKMDGSSVVYEIDLLDLTPLRGAIVEVPVKGHLDIPGYGITGKTLTALTIDEVKDHSSSGACSMGAGILALAGLALVLRKRG